MPRSGYASTEDLIAAAWEQALGRKPVDRNRDYRTLRVNTNGSLRIINNVWSATAIELPVNIFFETPTIAAMAALIDRGGPIVAPDLIRLRDGDRSQPLFLFPGGVGVLLELGDLVQALDYPGAIYGIAFSGLDGIAPIHDRIEREAARSLELIRQVQGGGPYRLVGYSFGGVTALETARLLRQNDAEDVFLALLDTAQNDHTWPLRVWLGFMLRKIGRKLARIAVNRARPTSKPPAATPDQGAREQSRLAADRRRGSQFTFRFRDPNHPDYPYYHPYWRGGYTPNYEQVAKNTCRLRGRYTPRRYDGPVIFFHSAGGDPNVCDPARVWPRYLPHIEWVRMPGNHLSMMVGHNAAALAGELSLRLKRTIVGARGAAKSAAGVRGGGYRTTGTVAGSLEPPPPAG